MGRQPKSEASSLSSAEVRRLWEEPTEAIPQNQREAAGILFLLGRGGCQGLPHVVTTSDKRALYPRPKMPRLCGPIGKLVLPGQNRRKNAFSRADVCACRGHCSSGWFGGSHGPGPRQTTRRLTERFEQGRRAAGPDAPVKRRSRSHAAFF